MTSNLGKIASGVLRVASPQIKMDLSNLTGLVSYSIKDYMNDGRFVSFTLALDLPNEVQVDIADVAIRPPADNKTALEGVGVSDILPNYQSALDLLAVGVGFTDGTTMFSPVTPEVKILPAAGPIALLLAAGWTPPQPKEGDIPDQSGPVPLNLGSVGV